MRSLKQILVQKCRKISMMNTRSLTGVVFDMDGTLTIPCLDFKKLRQQLCINDSRDILGHVESLSEAEKMIAMKTIEDFEEQGRRNLKLQPGIQELFHFLNHGQSLKLALVTRNNETAVDHFIKKCILNGICSKREEMFSLVLTRDFKPVKPSPAALFHIATNWSTSPNNILMIGDDKHDILCGNGAGATTILLNNEKNEATKELADFDVNSLLDIIPIIKSFMLNGLSKVP